MVSVSMYGIFQIALFVRFLNNFGISTVKLCPSKFTKSTTRRSFVDL